MGFLYDMKSLSHACYGIIRIEDMGLPPTFFDDLNKILELSLGYRPNLLIGLFPAVQRNEYIDLLVHKLTPFRIVMFHGID